MHDRTEPLPWGTLRLGESPALIGAMRTQARLVGFVIFALSLFAYATIIMGEFKFMDMLAGMESLTVRERKIREGKWVAGWLNDGSE